MWKELCNIIKDCKKAADDEIKIFKDECCGGKSIIQCAKDTKEYKEMKESWNKLMSKR